MAFLVFGQSLCSAIVLALCNLIFVENLKSQLSQNIPHVDVAGIIKAGATGFRSFVDPGDLPDILVAYGNSIDRVFYLVAALSAMCGVVLWGMGWTDLRTKTADDRKTERDLNGSKEV